MKIQNISDVNTFFKVIDSCKGTVELVSPEGDRINLKSSCPSICRWQIFFPMAISKSWSWLLSEKEDLGPTDLNLCIRESKLFEVYMVCTLPLYKKCLNDAIETV